MTLEGLCERHADNELWGLFGSYAPCRFPGCPYTRDTANGVCAVHDEDGWEDQGVLRPVTRLQPPQQAGKPDIDWLVKASESGLPASWVDAWAETQN